ncbi:MULTISPECIES: hypothetical protein [Clostridium]|uniref:Uncharacterized protein n=1 Tax=Clostridium intestinale TaxID=36845 RepID=A0A7D6ZX58_9CLOT|nr:MULTISPECIES: hypothetical protein [Clostridium]QLY79462.1 hypothetical protein HZF06_20895 [Clostridium intestinale]
MEALTLKLVNFILSINLQSVYSVLLGAIISAYISYRFTKWRENQRLKIDLQIKTTDMLIDIIKNFNTSASIMTSKNFVFFNIYNSTLESNKIDDSLDKINNDFKIILINQAKENAINNFEEYREIWINYSKAFMPIISILESREVILNKFVNDKDELIDEFQKLIDLQNDFTTLYYNDISNKILFNQLIADTSLEKVNKYQQKFMDQCIYVSCKVLDLQVKLQNEFLGKLFKYKVQPRKENK